MKITIDWVQTIFIMIFWIPGFILLVYAGGITLALGVLLMAIGSTVKTQRVDDTKRDYMNMWGEE